MTDYALLSTTAPDAETADRLAERLVAERLSACVQIVPITSVYRWEGRVERAPEHLLLCKIAVADFAAVSSAIAVIHPYDVPELTLTPIAATSEAYGAWLEASTRR